MQCATTLGWKLNLSCFWGSLCVCLLLLWCAMWINILCYMNISIKVAWPLWNRFVLLNLARGWIYPNEIDWICYQGPAAMVSIESLTRVYWIAYWAHWIAYWIACLSCFCFYHLSVAISGGVKPQSWGRMFEAHEHQCLSLYDKSVREEGPREGGRMVREVQFV